MWVYIVVSDIHICIFFFSIYDRPRRRKKVQHGTSGATIYHWVTQFYHRAPQFFIGLCNFSTRLQIPRVPIWNTGIHLYRRGPAWSVIYTEKKNIYVYLILLYILTHHQKVIMSIRFFYFLIIDPKLYWQLRRCCSTTRCCCRSTSTPKTSIWCSGGRITPHRWWEDRQCSGWRHSPRHHGGLDEESRSPLLPLHPSEGEPCHPQPLGGGACHPQAQDQQDEDASSWRRSHPLQRHSGRGHQD